MTAVLDRPNTVCVQATGPAQCIEVPRLVGLDLAGAVQPAGPVVDGHHRVRALVRVRSDHIIPTAPSLNS
jgi:hypothetical protein